MKKHLLPWLAVCLLLAGCTILDGAYHSVSPHRQTDETMDSITESVSNYRQLQDALANMVSLGADSQVITVSGFREQELLDAVAAAVEYVKTNHPIGAYAVDEILYKVGNVGNSLGVSVEITYRHGKGDIQKIRPAANMDEAAELIFQALARVDSGIVLLVEDFRKEDIAQLVDDYAAANPSIIMETPEVLEQLYPESGPQRVWELKFVYQTNRNSLLDMQELVGRVFDSAALYVTPNAPQVRQFSQLYGFLMERFHNYQIKSSITPAYSLLNYGVGDSFTIASVYAEMCSRAGLECIVVQGTLYGAPHYWNIVCHNGFYYHVDLIYCQSIGVYSVMIDPQMEDYVWDYSAYPKCPGNPQDYKDPEETTEPTDPDNTEPEDPTVPPTEPEMPTEPMEPTVPPTVPQPEDPTEPPTEPEIPPDDNIESPPGDDSDTHP